MFEIRIDEISKPDIREDTRVFVNQLIDQQIFHDILFNDIHFMMWITFADQIVYFNRMMWFENCIQKSHVVTELQSMPNNLYAAYFPITLTEVLTYIQTALPPVLKPQMDSLKTIDDVYEVFKTLLTDNSNPSTLKYNIDCFQKMMHFNDDLLLSYTEKNRFIAKLKFIASRIPKNTIVKYPIGIIVSSWNPVDKIIDLLPDNETFHLQIVLQLPKEQFDVLHKMIFDFDATVTQIYYEKYNRYYVSMYIEQNSVALKDYLKYMYREIIPMIS